MPILCDQNGLYCIGNWSLLTWNKNQTISSYKPASWNLKEKKSQNAKEAALKEKLMLKKNLDNLNFELCDISSKPDTVHQPNQASPTDVNDILHRLCRLESMMDNGIG